MRESLNVLFLLGVGGGDVDSAWKTDSVMGETIKGRNKKLPSVFSCFHPEVRLPAASSDFPQSINHCSLHAPINSYPGTNISLSPVVILSTYSFCNFFLCWEFGICPLYTCSQHCTMLCSWKSNLWNSIGTRCDKERRKHVENE